MTVEEFMEVLKRCDPHKPVNVGWLVRTNGNTIQTKLWVTGIIDVKADSPSSVASALTIVIKNPVL